MGQASTMNLFSILLLVGYALAMTFVFCRKPIFKWLRHSHKVLKVKKTIHKVLVEPGADSDTLAFALAVSDIHSEDLYAATAVHPAIKKRFSSRGKERIAEKAFLLRKDEHAEFYHNYDNWDTKLHNALREERRRERENPVRPASPPAPNPLIRELRRSLGELADRLERERTGQPEPVQQEQQQSPGQAPETLVEPTKKKG